MPTLVAVDGSEHGLDALALGRRLCAATGGELLVATVTPDPAEGERRLARYERDGRTLHLESADPAAALGAAARHHDAALVVVGSSSRGRAGRVRPGTMERLLADGRHAVAIAPRGFWRVGGRPALIAAPDSDTPQGATAFACARALAASLGGEVVRLGAGDAAALEDVTVLVSALRGHARTAAGQLDEVTAALVRVAPCPVLAVPRAAAAALERRLTAAQ